MATGAPQPGPSSTARIAWPSRVTATSSSPIPGTTGFARSTPGPGVITNFAGTGRKGFSGDGGPAAQAEFGGIYCLALDEASQTLALADLDNRRIRQIDLKTGVVTTVAGNGKKGVPADGRRRPHCTSRRSQGRRARRPGQPVYPGTIRARPASCRPVRKDPHRRRHRSSRRLGRRRRRPRSTAERSQTPLRLAARKRLDRRHREPPDSHLSSRKMARSRPSPARAGRAPPAWAARPATPSSASPTASRSGPTVFSTSPIAATTGSSKSNDEKTPAFDSRAVLSAKKEEPHASDHRGAAVMRHQYRRSWEASASS